MRNDGVYTFVAEREEVVVAWMLGVKAMTRVAKSFFDSKANWNDPLHIHQ
jgi:hypothetical protein